MTEVATGDGPESPFKETIVGKCVSFELALEPNDIFFGIVQRGAAVIMLKHIGVEPIPNYTRDVKQGWATMEPVDSRFRTRTATYCISAVRNEV